MSKTLICNDCDRIVTSWVINGNSSSERLPYCDWCKGVVEVYVNE